MRLNNIYRRVVRLIHLDVNKTNIWVFGEWFGDRCNDNSLYFANYVVNNSEKKVYWISNEKADLSLLDRKIIRIQRDSKESMKIIENAEAIIVNQSIYDVISDGYYIPKKSLLINIWHGVPWKKIFSDSEKNTSIISRLKRKMNCLLFPYDMFLVASISFEKIMIKQTNKRVTFIKAGCPKNSIFYDDNKCSALNKKIKLMFNISDETKIILYLPTFRDNNKEDFDFQKLVSNRNFIDVMENNKAVLIQKKHFSNAEIKYSEANTKYVINIDEEITTQELLATADLLITDYSSCMFDFLLLNKPIIHFAYDYDYFVKYDRGLYYSLGSAACGACVYDENSLINQIDIYLSNPTLDDDLRNKRLKEYMTYNSDNNNENVFKIISEEIKKH